MLRTHTGSPRTSPPGAALAGGARGAKHTCKPARERPKHPFMHKYPPPNTLLPPKHSLALGSEVNLAYKAAGAVKSPLHSVYLIFGEILAVLILPGQ